jgi:hypothetical protein
MLTPEENQRLTRVSRGTPMGELLRRYWQPACLSSELPEPDGAPLRLLVPMKLGLKNIKAITENRTTQTRPCLCMFPGLLSLNSGARF